MSGLIDELREISDRLERLIHAHRYHDTSSGEACLKILSDKEWRNAAWVHGRLRDGGHHIERKGSVNSVLLTLEKDGFLEGRTALTGRQRGEKQYRLLR